MIDQSGEVRWQRWTDRAICDSQGRVIEVQSTGRDITEQREAQEALREREQRFRTIWNRTPNAMALSDGEGTIQDVNQAYDRLLKGDVIIVLPKSLPWALSRISSSCRCESRNPASTLSGDSVSFGSIEGSVLTPCR